MITFDELVARHQAMQTRQAGDATAVTLPDILDFLEQARAAGRAIAPIQQREQLRAILRYWGAQVHDRTGDYPAVQLAPYRLTEPAQPQQTPPAEPEPAAPGPDERPFWFPWLRWLLPSLAALVVVLLLYAAIFNFNSSQNATVDATSPAVLTEVAAATRLSLDSDGDGLTDSEEALIGTNPNTPDTDGDGLTDSEEINLGTSPINPDTDGDGTADNVDPDPGQLPTPTPLPLATSTATPRATVPLLLPTNTPTLTPSPTATFPPDFTPSPTFPSDEASAESADTPVPTATPLPITADTLARVRLLSSARLDSPVQSAALSTNGRFLATGNSDGRIHLFDTRTGRETAVFTAHEGWVRALAFSPDSQLLASGGNDGLVRVFDLTTGQIYTTFSGNNGFIFAVAFNASGQWLAAAAGDGTVQLNNIATGAGQVLVDEAGTAVTHLAWHPSENSLAAGAVSGAVTLWTAAGEIAARLTEPETAVASLSWAAAGERLTATSSNASLYIWEAETYEACVLAPPAGSIQFAATADIGVVAANADADTQLTTLDLLDCAVTTVLPQHRDTLTQVALSATAVATGSVRGSVRLWTRDGSQVITLGGSPTALESSGGSLRATAIVHQSTITFLRFTPDGQKLISVDEAGTIGFWHVP